MAKSQENQSHTADVKAAMARGEAWQKRTDAFAARVQFKDWQDRLLAQTGDERILKYPFNEWCRVRSFTGGNPTPAWLGKPNTPAPQQAAATAQDAASTAELRPDGQGFQLYIQGVPKLEAPWQSDEPKAGALKYALVKEVLDANGAPVLYKDVAKKYGYEQNSVRAAAKEIHDAFGQAFKREKVGRDGAMKAIHRAALAASTR